MPLVTCGAGGSTNAEVVEQINNNTTENVFNVDSMTDILGIDFTIYKTTNVRGYYNPNDGGGDLFNYDSTVDKSTADAGTIIDPSVSLANQGTGIGLGCWIRQNDGAVYAEWFGAVGDGVADDTIQLQNALNTKEKVELGKHIYEITGTLNFAEAGQSIAGQGKLGQSVIRNSTTASPLFNFSVGTAPKARCGIKNIEFIGNALTTEGIALRGIFDDGLVGDADKSCWLEGIRIRDVGAGFGLRVSSWSNTISNIEIWNCDQGVKIGSECNSTTFINPYITGCAKEAVLAPVGPGIPSNITFIGGAYQYSGGTVATIHIEEGNSIVFISPYTEANTAPYSIYFDSLAHNCSVSNIMHNTVSISPATHIIAGNTGKANSILGVQLLGGTIQNMIKIVGSLPVTTVGATHISVGTVTGALIDDVSTRKATVILDGLNGSAFGPSEINALQAAAGWKYTEVDTGNEKFSIIDGKLYIGYQGGGSSPAIKSSGGTMQFVDNAGTGPADVALNSVRIGSLTANVKQIAGAGTPEGAITADVGSIFQRTDGAANTSFYVKESGTGTTGWVAK